MRSSTVALGKHKLIERREPSRFSGASSLGWIAWCGVSGLLSLITATIFQQAFEDGSSLQLFLVGIVIQTLIAYTVIIGAARARFSGDTFIHSLQWVFSMNSLTRVLSTILVTAALIVVIVVNGFELDGTSLNVIALLTMVIAVSRGLKYVYFRQYVDFIETDLADRTANGTGIKARATKIFRNKPWRLIVPIIQSIIVTMIPSQLFLYIATTFWDLNYIVSTIIIAILLPLSGAAWAQWHRWGGIIRIMHIGHGRKMAPFMLKR